MKRIMMKIVLLSVLFVAHLFPGQAASYGQVVSRKLSAAQAANLFIAISLAGKNFKPLKKQLIQAQTDIAQAAQAQGITFNSFTGLGDVHITLERIENINAADVSKYTACIQEAVDSAEPFDISAYLKKSYFAIFCDTGVLRFDTPEKSEIKKLVNQLRNRFKKAGLQVGIYNKYRAHISLGIFSEESVSKAHAGNLSWAPKINIDTQEHPCIIDKIDVRMNGKKLSQQFKLKKHEQLATKPKFENEVKKQTKIGRSKVVDLHHAIKQKDESCERNHIQNSCVIL